MKLNIEALERRYKVLYNDFQSGSLDETTFIAEVDQLQFQDDWGRYWMIGAQSGNWHYYDGQNWHQAHPDDADKLPFMDEQGRYWQRGAKSGDWYFYNPDSGEWVKPGQGDPTGPAMNNAQPQAAQPQAGSYAPATSVASPGPAPAGQQPPPAADNSIETELFQDDDGRYWSIGAKSGQWYFYDENGWHPADEFYKRVGGQAAPPPFAGQQAGYPPQQPYQPAPGDSQPMQPQPYPQPTQPGGYTPAPGQPPPQQPYGGQPPQVAREESAPYQAVPAGPQAGGQPPMPPPSPAGGQSGAWFYFDGNQWLQYANNEPPADSPPDPTVTVEQDSAAAKPKLESKTAAQPADDSEPIVAEYIEDQNDEPPVEVVDVEVITVFEPEPEPEPESEAAPPPAPRSPAPSPRPSGVAGAAGALGAAGVAASAAAMGAASAAQPSPPDPEPEQPFEAEDEAIAYDEEADVAADSPSPKGNSPITKDEVVPRRTRTPSGETPTVSRPASGVSSTPSVPRRTRGSSDTSRPASPRKRPSSGAHEPTIIIPTGATTGTPSAARVNRSSPSRPTTPMTPQRRAREDTLPMTPQRPSQSTPANPSKPAAPTPSVRHRQVTQAMPVVDRTATPKQPASAPSKPVSKPVKPTTPTADSQRARQATQELPSVKAKTDTTPKVPVKPEKPAEAEPEKSGYTLGDVLRAFPSTVWTGVAGVAVLILFALLIISGATYAGSWFGSDGVAAVQSPTPTLASGPPDSTPTPGPTPTNSAAGPVATPTDVALATYASEDLDLTLEYPENWVRNDEDGRLVFAPTAAGLETDAVEAAGMHLGVVDDEDITISDLLAQTLAEFPTDAEILNEGTISIGSQTWTSTQIRYDDEAIGGEGIATLAVTTRDNIGYFLMAVAPADDWNSVQPVFQDMINSFRFGAEAVVAQATVGATRSASTGSGTRNATTAATASAADDNDNQEEAETDATADEEADEEEATVTPTPRPTATPTPEAEATPLVYAIQSGDNLLSIATRFGVDLDLLTSENGINDPSGLQIGQELTIPFTAEQLADYNAGRDVAAAPTSSRSGATAADDEDEEDTAAADADQDETAADDEADDAEASAASPTAAPTEESAAAPVSGRIVYPAFNNGTGVYDVWMVDLATGEQTPIAGAASQPAFNKDGSLLAYRSWDRGNRGIFFRDFIGGRSDVVAKFVEDGLPTWTPDNFSFVFSSRKEGDRVPRIYIGNQQGEDPFSIGFQGEYPAVMPNGRLVVKGCTITGDCGMFMMGARGGGENKLTGDSSDTAPAPSPDGSKIAFMSYNRGGNNWEVYVMNADGSNPQRLTEDAAADGLPTWSPDGQTIAFVSNRGGAWSVWGMNPDGSGQRKLFDMQGSPDGNILYDEFNSRGWLEERISWAP